MIEMQLYDENGRPARKVQVDVDECPHCKCLIPSESLEGHLERRCESPQAILSRLAAKLGCEPRQVADRVIRMLEERAHVR